MKPRMSMITLAVADLDRSVRFYGEGLGFPRYDDAEDIALFRLNGTWLGLYGRDALAEDAGIDSIGSGFGGFSISHNVSCEAEVEEVVNLAVAAGARLVKKPRKTSWGGFGGYFSDPDGHLWEVAHNPFTWIGPVDDD